MTFELFSKNGAILPIEHATIPLSNIEYSYGYGVYETLKVRNGILYFVDQHIERLFHSAHVIDLLVPFSSQQIKKFIQEFVKKLHIDACNIKMLLIGGDPTNLYIFASAPLFPDRKLYKQGTKLISYTYERLFPTAKTLNMLPSYMAYKKAKQHGCYDTLLIDHHGMVLEGTRTNFCLVKGTTIYRAPKERVLEGVTFLTLEKIVGREHFKIVEKDILLKNIKDYDGAFITSTSTKIMPVSLIDDFHFPPIPPSIRKLMSAYDKFLDESKGVLT